MQQPIISFGFRSCLCVWATLFGSLFKSSGETFHSRCCDSEQRQSIHYRPSCRWQPQRRRHESPKDVSLHPCHHGAPVCIDGQRRILCRHPSKMQDGVGHDGEWCSVPNDAMVTFSCRCVGFGSGRFAGKVCLMWRDVDDGRRRLDRTVSIR